MRPLKTSSFLEGENRLSSDVALKDLQIPACHTLFCIIRQMAVIIGESAKNQPK
jgi:hypothetical protein